MTISPLPEPTIRHLGSSVTITTPQDLVKELLDNAIDAEATFVEVNLSSDIVEKVQVRDNGHGISLNDFEALGRRAHTSKLKSFEEVVTKGGQTLGFRGEALAAANSISNITIITRTKSDPVGSRLQLKYGVGGVEDRRPVSTAVGTIVRATKLFDKVPVRKQHVSKQPQKNIAGIKLLMQAYALAMPYLKLSLKIQGEPRAIWDYTPNSSCLPNEAVLQMFGNRAAADCIHVNLSTLPDVQMEALMPPPNRGITTLKATSSFVSVDARPLTSSRGIGKKLIGVLKFYLGKASASQGETYPSASTFLQLSIRCEPGIYDPNVTPLKDEVIFRDEKRILDCFEEMCKKAYRSPERFTTIELGESSAQPTDDELSRLDSTQTQPAQSEPISKAFSSSSRHVSNLGNPAVDCAVTISDLDSVRRLGRLPMVDTSEKLPHHCSTPITHPPDNGNTLPHHPESREKSPSSLAYSTRTVQVEGQPRFVSATMRTKMRVDLSRKDSDATDDGVTMETIDVQILRLPSSPHPVVSPKPRVSRSLGSIENYFRPKGDQDFQIAIDNTATAGSPSKVPSLLGSPLGQHQPLQPLKDSVLNRIYGEAELIDEVSSSDSEILQSSSSLRGDLETRHNGGQHNVSSDNIGQIGRGGILRPPERDPRLRQGRGLQPSSSPTTNIHGLRTPPSSDPSQGQAMNGTSLNSGLSRPTTAVAPAPMPHSTTLYSTNAPYSADPVQRDTANADQTSVRTRVSTPRTRLTNNSISHTDPLVNHRDLAPYHRIVQNDPATRRSAQVKKGQAILTDNGRNTIAETTDEPDTLTTDTSRHVKHYSHALQAMLMKTPPPHHKVTVQYSLRTEPHVENVYDKFPAVVNRDIVSDRDRPQRPDSCEDPRSYFIRTKQLGRNNRRLQRCLSKNLPLERVPENDQIQRIVAKERLQLYQLKRLIRRTVELETAVGFEAKSPALHFNDVSQGSELEAELRRVVGSWQEATGLETEVHFTLRVGVNECKASEASRA